MIVFASVEDVVYDASTVLRIPVLILALAALAVVIVELGGLAVELVRRRRRDSDVLERARRSPPARADSDEARNGARRVLRGAASSDAMAATFVRRGRTGPRAWRRARGSRRASPTTTCSRCGGSSARACSCAPVPRSA